MMLDDEGRNLSGGDLEAVVLWLTEVAVAESEVPSSVIVASTAPPTLCRNHVLLLFLLIKNKKSEGGKKGDLDHQLAE